MYHRQSVTFNLLLSIIHFSQLYVLIDFEINVNDGDENKYFIDQKVLHVHITAITGSGIQAVNI